jgi:hypothetical protein
MTDSTRRAFLATAGLSTAVGVAAVVAPASAAVAEDVTLPANAQGPMIEGREVIVSDKRLVARLARAFARAGRS